MRFLRDRLGVRLVVRVTLMVSVGIALFAVVAPVQAQENLRIIDGLSDRLARIRDLSADFIQIVDNGVNQPRREEGHLYLERGRARWEYDYPETRLYLIDGNVFTDYLPGDSLLRRRFVDEDFFDRIPLMRILGQSDLVDEFERIDLLGVPPQVQGARVFRLFPRRESAIDDIILEVDPDTFDLRRLLMRYQDGSTNDIVFDRIVTNVGLTDALWEIVPAPGTDIVDTVN